MTGEEYQEAVKAAGMCAYMLQAVDIPDILARIEKAEAIGPALDPTLYRDKAAAMQMDKELLEAALPLWKKGKQLREEAEKRQAAGAQEKR